MQKQEASKHKQIAYSIVCVLLAVSLTGFGWLRYTIYVAPLPIVLLWLLEGAKAPNRNQWAIVAPFFLLVILFVLYIPFTGIAAWKWTFFVMVYTTIFLFIDFSRAKLQLIYLNAIIIVFFLLAVAQIGPVDLSIQSLARGLVDSHVSTESTFAFPLGLFSCYWLIQRRFLLATLNIVLVIFAFKRIVFVAFAAFLLTLFLPRWFRRSWIFAIALVVGTAFSSFVAVEFATGRFDDVIVEYTGQSPSQFSLGRKDLWDETLQNIRFTYERFLFVGAGIDSVLRAGRPNLQRWIPFHNDVLVVYLAYGFIALLFFLSLLVMIPNSGVRALTVFLICLFLSDNVLIYQHVMLVYLFMISQLLAQDVSALNAKKKPAEELLRGQRNRFRLR